ncbi:MAG: hypothetical protein WBG86_18225 [Polyangiales bacterium]
MAVSKEQLTELEDALADLGKGDDEVSAVLSRFADAEALDLAEVDGALDALTENIEVAPVAVPVVMNPSAMETRVPDAPYESEEDWESDQTEVEVIDASDDFVLLVDEDDLDVLEAASDEVPAVTVPPPIPGEKASDAGDPEVDPDADEEDEGFFKKLFGSSRRTSNRP